MDFCGHLHLILFRKDRTITVHFYGGDGELIRETSDAARPPDE
jgi:hypothetical protein